MSSYKHLSGAEKRKRARLQEEAKQKSKKITSFFVSQATVQTEVIDGVSSEAQCDDHDIQEQIGGDLNEPFLQGEGTSSCNVSSISQAESDDTQRTDDAEDSNNLLPMSDDKCDITTEGWEQRALTISEWPDLKTDKFIEGVLNNLPKSDPIENTKKMYKDSGQMYFRNLNESVFYRTKSNGGREKREWLIYDGKLKSVFCFPCKLFSKEITSLNSKSGYSDWRNIFMAVKLHEQSKNHIQSMCILTSRLSIANTIDTALKLEIQKECEYWRNVLKRIIATIKFLSAQGLAFRGSDENLNSPHRGNYLSCLVYLAEFDSFLAEHLRKYGNKGKGTVSYLSHQICNEFLGILENKLIELFVNEIKSAKYYSLIVDSTPDISHCDQLTFILRYIHNGQVVERFLGFIKIEKHTAEYLKDVVLKKLEVLGLKIENCRGQSYDNAANMSGNYNGLQARIKRLSPTAVYIPCASHSLNLSVNFSSESCLQASNYFSLVQEIYVFFSSSTHRWSILLNRCKISLKRLSDTRWSARADAVAALKLNYKAIIDIFSAIANDQDEKPITKNEASALLKKMQKFEPALLTTIWCKILERVNATSKALQDPSLNIFTSIELLKSLVSFVQTLRGNFDSTNGIENEAATLVDDATYKEDISRTRKRKLFFDESKENEVHLSGKEKFKVEAHYVICDSIIQDLERRIKSYHTVDERFKCFFSNIDDVAFEESVNILKNTYTSDVEVDVLNDEMAHFRILCDNMNKKEMIEKFELVQSLKSTFPNVLTLLEIFFTIPVSNASGERSFSALKRIKTYLRSTISQERLDALSLIHIEGSNLEKLDCNLIIDQFAKNKCRKKHI